MQQYLMQLLQNVGAYTLQTMQSIGQSALMFYRTLFAKPHPKLFHLCIHVPR